MPKLNKDIVQKFGTTVKSKLHFTTLSFITNYKRLDQLTIKKGSVIAKLL